MKPPTLAVAFVVLVSACTSGPPPRTYLLNRPLEATGASPSMIDNGVHLQLVPVLVPDYLDNTDLLVRDGLYEMKASAKGRWGERLSRNITHALGAALSSQLPQGAVTLDPMVNSAYRQIAVDIDSFDVWEDGHCALSATWTTSAGAAKAPSSNGRGVYLVAALSEPHPVNDADRVAAMSKAIDRLADSIILDTQRSATATLTQ